MAKKGKKFLEAKEKLEPNKKYELADAVAKVKEVSYSKFDGSVEVHIKTSANPKYNDQAIRGTVSLPHGTGKTLRVAAFVSSDKVDEAKKAGADIAGNEELLTAIEKGSFNFDVLVTTAEMMRDLAKVAKVLGPKGLMPSPKAGTVATDLTKTIDELKKGRVEFKLDKTGNIHVAVGKISFSEENLSENIAALMHAVQENKPSGVKGKLIEKMVLAPTMGPGVSVAWTE